MTIAYPKIPKLENQVPAPVDPLPEASTVNLSIHGSFPPSPFQALVTSNDLLIRITL